MNAFFTVIPAKAGIQGYEVRSTDIWMPAFAGMTLQMLLRLCSQFRSEA